MTDATQPSMDLETASTEVRVTDRSGERGQGLIEYAFILILIAITLIIALQVLGGQTSNLFSNIQNGMSVASGH